MNKRRNPLLVLAATLVGMSISSTAFAGSLAGYELVTLIQLSGTSGNVALAKFSADLTGGPSCASSNRDSVAFDISTERGKAALALFQGAMLSGKRIRVTGTGTCSVHSSTETLGWLGAAD